jgi:sugar phosphate isomerase/epimerase
VAEILPGNLTIADPEDILDLMVEAGYNGCEKLILHRETLNDTFFDLKTRVAGEILQKFSNYRMKLAIVGDFSGITSKSLRDFIRESNNRGIITFVDSVEKAVS